ncbi:protein IQ-DOMAIN 14 [Neltuma alba]|uniref:protein IQ-DOMAIN 14 n=1 Tax=Neltuma alba TaxID=207710 RepID=UPI0010A3ED4F|nr:protein IQ-DOMAIN 14-like [Prosopis alba]XP_028760626.1 protein IQ-DOMAIN 14-like [Prosopis alba]XP_028760627.1 protein IQ-DOMAIN 14-like [Prosopis alba]XP_028760628.1 protein IQ-DOMAIN 14-like [Prosopis alba]XP_028760629.1 protein IQ-DOMAIN 14-like [Prosopis alba]XP_028783096.1 protein IQ-DOMAIN 14-like [Prosopis alba]XP_028783097.1 protein IQ-DOMAIN 14-like [Prosopis alba]XP_028783098.1 protein IQ-DOMAIN 14-like [Prosopis alba]XP_028783099.1 protein IQ-DOMAIN 14-like [Prosopis alba]
MAKRKSWFGFVKRLFVWDAQSKPEKKEKRRKWIFGIGRLKIKRLPSITAPPATQKETKQEVEKLNNGNQCYEETEELQIVNSRIEAPQPTSQCHGKIEESSAIKIQTTFRGYLARKALRALKGIVKLQAIIRGRAVRRQTMSTLKCLQSLVDIQSQVCAKRLQMVKGRWDYDENQEIPSSRDKIIRMDSNGERRWDDSILLKEETNVSHMSKKEAEIKRERMKEYSFNHRRSAESERKKVNGRLRYWMEQWVDTQLSKSKELEDLDSVYSSHYGAGEEDGRTGRRQLLLRNIQSQRQNQIEGLGLYSPKLAPVRKLSPHRRQHSLGNDELSSPSVLPPYMAATESARAKARSSSSPKLRTVNVDPTKLDGNSPCKKKLYFVSSSINQPRSPSLKAVSGPIRASRTMKDLSINSDSSFLYGYNRDWDGPGIFK